jgi:hypothetical protein
VAHPSHFRSEVSIRDKECEVRAVVVYRIDPQTLSSAFRKTFKLSEVPRIAVDLIPEMS